MSDNSVNNKRIAKNNKMANKNEIEKKNDSLLPVLMQEV